MLSLDDVTMARRLVWLLASIAQAVIDTGRFVADPADD